MDTPQLTESTLVELAQTVSPLSEIKHRMCHHFQRSSTECVTTFRDQAQNVSVEAAQVVSSLLEDVSTVC